MRPFFHQDFQCVGFHWITEDHVYLFIRCYAGSYIVQNLNGFAHKIFESNDLHRRSRKIKKEEENTK